MFSFEAYDKRYQVAAGGDGGESGGSTVGHSHTGSSGTNAVGTTSGDRSYSRDSVASGEGGSGWKETIRSNR